MTRARPDRPRCGRCQKPGRLLETVEGPRCGRCYDQLPTRLRKITTGRKTA